MPKYIKTYLDYYWVEKHDIICEVCWMKAVNIHHITFRSKYWKKTKNLQDNITNLIALCNTCHNKAHGIWWRLKKEDLQEIHNKNLKNEETYL